MANTRRSVHRLSATRAGAPEEVSASEFRNSCLELIDRVHQTREEIVVTRYGRPVAKLVAYDEARPALFGLLEGSVVIHGDIVAPLGEAWDAED